MLLQRPATKKEKKKASKKRLGLLLIVLGLLLITLSLIGIKFLTHDPIFLSPLSQNQESSISRIIQELKESKIDYQKIITNDDLSYTVDLGDDRQVVLDSNKNISHQLSSLQLIIAQLKIDGKTFRRLDFRYQKPVITF